MPTRASEPLSPAVRDEGCQIGGDEDVAGLANVRFEDHGIAKLAAVAGGQRFTLIL